MKRLFCMLNRHKPRRETARWDGITYAGTCRRCGLAILRQDRGIWTAMPEGPSERP